jgi:hypothetical protein
MAVPDSGAISLAGIRAEVGNNTYDASATTGASLSTLAAETTFNTNSSSYPNSDVPHAMSEWYSYDHDATAAWANAYSVSKSTSTGVGETIRQAAMPAGSAIHFDQDSAFTISIWVKAGWTVDLNTNIFFWAMGDPAGSSWWDDTMALYYKENQNRLAFFMRSNNSGSNRDIDAAWLFHSNSGAYAESYAAAGLGATYWSATNRGYNSNDWTMITLVKTSSTASSSLKLYWNANDCGAADVTADTNASTMSMATNTTRELCIGSTLVNNSYIRCGDGDPTKFDEFAIWNEALTSAEITAIYNSGTPINLTSNSGDYTSSSNLQLYHQFENNGTANTDAVLSGSNYNLTVSGDSTHTTH